MFIIGATLIVIAMTLILIDYHIVEIANIFIRYLNEKEQKK